MCVCEQENRHMAYKCVIYVNQHLAAFSLLQFKNYLINFYELKWKSKLFPGIYCVHFKYVHTLSTETIFRQCTNQKCFTSNMSIYSDIRYMLYYTCWPWWSSMYTHTHILIRTCMHTGISTCTYTCVHTRTHTLTHTHMHTLRL